MQRPIAPAILGAALLGCGGGETTSGTGSISGSSGAGAAIDQRVNEL